MEEFNFIRYVEPELFIAVPAVYIVGMAIKTAEMIKDKYIPVVLSVISFLICLMYFLSSAKFSGANEIFEIIFGSFIQGQLIAACSVYGNQVLKQLKKED